MIANSALFLKRQELSKILFFNEIYQRVINLHVIAFAWFDFNLYQPTLECLNIIKPHLIRGAIIGFDELIDPKFPGETLALKEFVSLNSLKIQRNQFCGMQSYFIFD